SSIGCKKWVSASRSKDDNTPLFQVTYCPATNERLCHRRHLDCCLHACVHTQFFHGVLHGKRIHDRSKHTHIIGSCAVDTRCGSICAAPDISASDHYSYLYTERMNFLNLTSNTANCLCIDAIAFVKTERLTTQFKQDTLKCQG